MAFSKPLNEKPSSDGVKEKILTYLPIEEAGRTSILSTKWRHKWASIPELSFSDHKIISYLGCIEDYLSSASWLKESQLIFNHLKYVKLELFYLMETDVPFVLSLLQRAPLLESLDIKCLSFRLTNGPWETVDSRESWFEKLRTVNIIIDYGLIYCIAALVKHILLSAPQLVILTMKEKYSKYKGDEK